MPPKKPKPFEIHTNAEWRQLGKVAENRPNISINPADLPERFHPLIPFAERWAIRCDVTRHDYFEKQTKEDIQAFARTVEPYGDEIQAWLETLVEVDPWPEGANHFLYMLKAQAEAWYELPPDERSLLLKRRRDRRER